MFQVLIVGALLGTITYMSWIAYYFIYCPKVIKKWFEKKLGRLFILDIALTIFGTFAFSKLSDSLTAVIAGSVLGLLGTFTTLGLVAKSKICEMLPSSK